MAIRFFNRRNVLRRSIVLLLTAIMIFPVGALAPLPPQVALANFETETNAEDTPTDCPPYPEEASGATQGQPPVKTSEAPVFFYRGSAVEAETDLYLPGPTFDWSHTRSYDSRLATVAYGGGGDPAVYPQWSGTRWFSNIAGPYLKKDDDHVDIFVTASTKRRMAGPPSSGAYTVPAGMRATFEVATVTDSNDYDGDSNDTESIEIFTLTLTDSGTIYKFLGFSASIASTKKGKLAEKTNRTYESINKNGIRFYYGGVHGLVDYVITADPQLWLIDYSYTSGRVSRISVEDDDENEIQYAEYTYFDSGYSADLGSENNLIQVKVGRKTSDGGWTTRYTQYRYSNSQLKMVLESDAIARITQAGNTAVDTPEEILNQNDSYVVANGFTIAQHASRSFTYYGSNESTSSVATPFGTDNLEADYGGSPLDEDEDQIGLVKTETIHGVCGSCGASGNTVTRKYFYMWVHEGTEDPNEVEKIVLEDTDVDGTADNGNEVHRRIYGLNHRGVALREVLIEDPDAGTLKAWCNSMTLANGFVAERRMPSAHTSVDSNTEIATFLNPYTAAGTGWANDSATLDDAGVVYLYDYESGGQRVFDVKVKQGESGTANYLRSTDYGNGSTAATWDVVATCEYPTATPTRGNGNTTTYAYTYWSGTGLNRPKKVVATLPEVGTSENGSGTAATLEAYWDQLGRLRWTMDGEGYVDYFSYHPDTGQLAYRATDVPDSYSPTVDNTKWVAVTDGDADDVQPSRGAAFGALSLVTTIEFDAQGREVKRTEPGSRVHYTRYEANRTLQFPYWDGTANESLLPVEAVVTDDGGVLTETYEVDPAKSEWDATYGLPKLNGETSGDYTAWTEFDYESVSGQLASVKRYHNISGSGSYTTSFLYDDQGRLGATIEEVAASQFQVTVHLFDVLDRVIETRRGVVSSAPTGYAALAGGSPASGYARLSRTYFDGGDDTTPLKVGDGHVTQTKQHNDLTAGSYTLLNFYRTFRGHLRGVERQFYDGSSLDDVTPYAAMDIDWMGRTTGSALYTSEPNWSTLQSGYSGYLSSNGTGRNFWTKTYYDVLDRVYRTEKYPGAQALRYFEYNNYYDRDDRLVASGDKHGAHLEYAYDGAGRRYQSRTVLDVQATKYTSGAFNYCEPLPDPHWKAGTSGLDTTNVATGHMNGGDEGVIEFEHLVHDDASNVVQRHVFEVNHNETNGLDFADDDYVRRSVYSWFDDADRVEAMADYGSGDGSGVWQYAGVPGRPAAAPSTSTSSALVTKYAYHDDSSQTDNDGSGRLWETTIWQGDSPEVKTVTRRLYDDLGRETYVIEGYDDFESPDTWIGDSSNKWKDRVTKREYNGLDRVAKLTAYNSDGTNDNPEVTEYLYGNSYHASLITLAKYPDGNTTIGMGENNVQMSYHLDGRLATRKDQRGVVITYSYDEARRMSLQAATTIPGTVDGHVRSISYTYDSMGRPDTVTSNGALSSVRNQIEFTRTDTGQLDLEYQSHENAVDGSTPYVNYGYDTSSVLGIYTKGLRQSQQYYPSSNDRVLFSYATGASDRLSRISSVRYYRSGTGPGFNYSYNGTRRLVSAASTTIGSLKREMFGGTATVYDAWDRFGRTIRHDWNGLDDVSYKYDLAGNRLEREITVTGINTRDQKYAYDPLNRLTSVEEGQLSSGSIINKSFEQDFTLDQLGNWDEFDQDDDGNGTPNLEQKRYHNEVNAIDGNSGNPITLQSMGAGTDWADPQHDAAGNMTVMPRPKALGSSYTAKYDAWNRLVEVKAGMTVVQTNEYDGLHRRIIRDETGGSDDIRHFYYNERWQVVEERIEVSGTIDSDPLIRNVWHPYYIDALALRAYDDDLDGTAEYQYFTHDANFNVTALYTVSGTFNARERYVYSPYGEVTYLHGDFSKKTTQATSYGNEVLYTGRKRDPETALYDFRTRFYHAELGRFTSRDWIEYGGGMNLYGYVGGMPTRYVDPFGLDRVIYIDGELVIVDDYVDDFGNPTVSPPRDWGAGPIDTGWPINPGPVPPGSTLPPPPPPGWRPPLFDKPVVPFPPEPPSKDLAIIAGGIFGIGGVALKILDKILGKGKEPRRPNDGEKVKGQQLEEKGPIDGGFEGKDLVVPGPCPPNARAPFDQLPPRGQPGNPG